ncbi:hypothetical protein BJY01DRAFT_149162 [Aspergillus pseudoustus]|uniref:Uncharacterized protein n=1 Tax=Aspergillus pseudoustus TaxID=1810923 RepID=A0ABR4KA35_9EURO
MQSGTNRREPGTAPVYRNIRSLCGHDARSLDLSLPWMRTAGRGCHMFSVTEGNEIRTLIAMASGTGEQRALCLNTRQVLVQTHPLVALVGNMWSRRTVLEEQSGARKGRSPTEVGISMRCIFRVAARKILPVVELLCNWSRLVLAESADNNSR